MKPRVTNIPKLQKCSCALWPCHRVWEAFAQIQSGLFEDAWTSSFTWRGHVSGLQDRPHQLKPSSCFTPTPHLLLPPKVFYRKWQACLVMDTH